MVNSLFFFLVHRVMMNFRTIWNHKTVLIWIPKHSYFKLLIRIDSLYSIQIRLMNSIEKRSSHVIERVSPNKINYTSRTLKSKHLEL